MKIKTNELLQELTQRVNTHLSFAKTLRERSNKALNYRAQEDSWSALECLEHLNRYGQFYIPEINTRMQASKTTPDPLFYSGRLGNKFAMDMLPKEGMKTMKTFKSKNPIHSHLSKEDVIGTFIEQQLQFLDILQKAQEKNLSKIKTSITLPLLKLRLGDTLRFVIYHNERHVVQAKKVVEIDL